MSKKDLEKALEKDLEKEINILEHEIFIERVLTRAMGKNTISLRDHFAGLAMQGFIQYMGCDPEALLYPKREQKNKHALSKSAYAYADAMLKERENKDE